MHVGVSIGRSCAQAQWPIVGRCCCERQSSRHRILFRMQHLPGGPKVPAGKATQQLPVALAHAALSMAANSALKREAPRILTFVSRKPYDVTPTTALSVRL